MGKHSGQIALGHRLPRFLAAPLFGDRRRFGLEVDPDDSSWREWEKVWPEFYRTSQREGPGVHVNDAGYRICERIDFANRSVLEIGPGDLRHIRFWKDKPARYVVADRREESLKMAADGLREQGVAGESILIDSGWSDGLPFSVAEFDIVVSFYSLEHLHPLSAYLDTLLRLLKPGGLLVGAIPAEGGVAWGLSRYLTTRRWLKRHTTINPDKIICWEHPNFSDTVVNHLDKRLVRRHLGYWPFALPVIDVNLILRFIYEKPGQ